MKYTDEDVRALIEAVKELICLKANGFPMAHEDFKKAEKALKPFQEKP